MVVGSTLLLIICVRVRWSTVASKATLFSRCEKLAIFIANPHSYNSVME